MPFFKKSKTANLGSTSSEVTLVDPSANQTASKGKTPATKSKHTKQTTMSLEGAKERDKWNTMEARLAYIINK